jgi:hypothetical protein
MSRPARLAIPGLQLLALLLASAATASTYKIPACNNAPGKVNNAWVWSTNDIGPPSHFAEHANCPYRLGATGGNIDKEGGLSTTDELGLHDGAQPGTTAGWTTTAPPGTEITGLEYEPYIGHEIDPSNDWSPALRADGTIIPGQTCTDTVQNSETCFVGGPPGHGQPPQTLTGLHAHELTLGITCQAPPETECVTGALLYGAWAAMYSATITITDPTPPTIQTPTGTLWEEEPIYRHGAQALNATVEDAGGGIRSIELDIDGQPHIAYHPPCDYTLPQPCPASIGPLNLTLDTTGIHDGPHAITITTVDAAGNQTTTPPRQILVDNEPPPQPSNPTSSLTQPDGQTFTVQWDNSNQETPIASGTYMLCRAGTAECTTPTTTAPSSAIVTLPSRGTWSLALWLTDINGLSNPSDPAYLVLTAPAETSQHQDHSHSLPPTEIGRGPSAHPMTPDKSPSKTPTKTVGLHITAPSNGHKLKICISGPHQAKGQIKYIIRARGHTIESGNQTIRLHAGHGCLSLKHRHLHRYLLQVNARVGKSKSSRQVTIAATTQGRPLEPSRPKHSDR